MGVRFPSVVSNVFVGPLPANATETVVCVSPPLSPPLDGAIVLLMWMFTALAGTGQTAYQFAIRRGTTTAGVLVGASAIWANPVTAAASYLGSGSYFDVQGPIAGQQYALTLIQFNATAAGTFRDTFLAAFYL